MGKRNKEPQVGRRRPMIQLGGSSQKSGIGVVSRNALKEEEKENKEKEVVPDEIEDQLAGFLAEINSLDDTPGSSAPTSSPSKNKNNSATPSESLPSNTKSLYDVDTFDPVTQSHLLPENWQAIYDDSTSYYYYWNTVTNEVQWYAPLPPVSQDPPPPPPMEEEGTQEDESSNNNISNTGLSEQNGFHNQPDSTNSESNKNVDNLTVENNVDNIYKNDETIDDKCQQENKTCTQQQDEVVSSNLYNSQSDVDGHHDICVTREDESVSFECNINVKKEKIVPEGNEIEKQLNNVIVDNYPDVYDEYAENSTQPLISSELRKDEVDYDNRNNENIIDPYAITTATFKDKPVAITTTIFKDKPVEKVVQEEDNVDKDKDKELMSKIKEKIQRKKEEKLRKEKEEIATKNKGDEDIFHYQKAKEEMLREKLIKKKYEREKALTAELVGHSGGEKSVDECCEDVEANASCKGEELFSVDMFASEETYEKTTSVTLAPNTSKHQLPPENYVEKDDELTKDDKVDQPKDVVDENSTKERGGWRIIDAVYDDDDDEDDEDSDSVDDRQVSDDDETMEKSKGEMDDYAEMLLEDAIGEKDKTRPKYKKKKSKHPFIPALPLEAPPPPPPEPENPPLPPEDEPLPQPPQAPTEEDGNVQAEIESTKSMLLEKLTAHGISRGDVGKLQQCFIELETRMQDWMAGALDSKYFLDRLKEVDMEILKHETAPAGWISHWSSNFKMYYYYNSGSGTSQWDYPTVTPAQPLIPIQPSHPLQPGFPDYPFQPPMASSQGDHPTMLNENDSNEIEASPNAFSAPPPPPPPETTTQVTVPASAASLVSPAHGFSREPLPVKTRKRTVPQDPEKSADPYRDPYRLSKRKKEIQAAQSSSDSINDDGLHLSGTDSGTASPVPASIIAAGPIMRETLSDITQDISGQSFAHLTPPPPPPPVNEINESAASPKQDSPAPSVVRTKAKKKKKLETSAPSKKLKHVSSLVQKWQTVKQQVEEEENVEEEEDEDYETASERRINDWKKEMENSDSRVYNPNFTEIKGDWRERVKRKATT